MRNSRIRLFPVFQQCSDRIKRVGILKQRSLLVTFHSLVYSFRRNCQADDITGLLEIADIGRIQHNTATG